MTTDAHALEQLLQDEYETLKGLANALAEEYAALLDSNVDALESATSAKTSRIQAHSAQQQKRLQWMADQGLPRETALTALIDTAGSSPTLLQLGERLISLAQESQEANLRNGGFIVRLQERNRGALDVLRQEESGDLYSLSGAREHHSDSRTLGKA